MTKLGQDFSRLKPGDKVWLRLNEYEGWGLVTFIDQGAGYLPIRVEWLKNEYKRDWFSNKGTLHPDGPQVVFFSEPTLTLPPEPERLVEKEIMVRPFKTWNGGISLSTGLNQPMLIYIGPEQLIKVKVRE